MPHHTPHVRGDARLLLLSESSPSDLDPVVERHLGSLPPPVLLTVGNESADALADALPELLAPLTSLEVAVLMGPLASETWRRHGAFQLHVTLVETPSPMSTDPRDTERMHLALQGVAAMLG